MSAGRNPRLSSARGAPISFDGVGRRFGAVHALRDFTLDVAAGEFVTLLGPSGSGKTTALNILAGFLDPTAGDVLINGMSIARLATEKRNVGMVFQNYSLFPHMSVLDNVAFPLRMRGVPIAERRSRAEAALAMVHLAGYGARRPQELSGGQRQRVAFARAVVFEPPVLLMDEPLGALDLKLREAMQDEIRQIQRRIGCTVIYVTHDQTEALALSNRIVVMSDGSIQQVGTPVEIYDRPANEFVARFVGEINMLPASVEPGGLLLAGQTVRSAAAAGLPAGWRGQAAIRPEHLQRSVPGSTLVEIGCTILDVAFGGGSHRYVAEADGLGPIIVREQRRPGVDVLAIGQRATFGFDTRHAAFLPHQSTVAKGADA